MADIQIQARSTGSAVIPGTRHGNTRASDGSGRPAAPRVANRLSFAAAPTFAIMALVSGISASGQPDMICSAMHDMSPPTGMVAMYALMSLFHLTPWLRLISTRRNGLHPF